MYFLVDLTILLSGYVCHFLGGCLLKLIALFEGYRAVLSVIFCVNCLFSAPFFNVI